MKKLLYVLIVAFVLSVTGSAFSEEMIVVRGDENYPPMEMIVDNTLTGFHVEIVNAVAAKMGVTVKWESFPWKRAIAMVEQGEADAITYIGRNPEREAFAIFLDENYLSSAKICFFVLKANEDKIRFDGDAVKLLAGKELLKMRGFSYGEEIDKMANHEVDSMIQMVKMMEAGRYEIAIVNWTDLVGILKGQPELDLLAPLSPPVAEIKNFIAFSKARKAEELARRFEEAFVSFKKTPEYESLVKKYEIVQ